MQQLYTRWLAGTRIQPASHQQLAAGVGHGVGPGHGGTDGLGGGGGGAGGDVLLAQAQVLHAGAEGRNHIVEGGAGAVCSSRSLGQIALVKCWRV